METRTLSTGYSDLEVTANADEMTKDALYEKVIEWIEKRGIAGTSGEGIMQDDDCQIEAAPLIAEIVDDILEVQTQERDGI